MKIGVIHHLFVMSLFFISIYFIRYTRVYDLRQKECQEPEIHDTVWITRQSTPQGKYSVLESGRYLLYFSQTHAPAIGEHVEFIGRVRDQSQCANMPQLALIVQRYSRIEINTLSYFYLIHHPRASLETLANKYLSSTEETMYRFLPSSHVHVVLGMTIGRKYSSQEEISVAMKNAGMTHVLVASGANIALLIQFTRAVMRKILSRKMLIIVSLIVAGVYVVVVGNQAPILRAFLMFSFISLASLLGRKTQWYYPLFSGVFILLIYQPLFIFSLSFWLTVAASTAILIQSAAEDPEMISVVATLNSQFTQTFQSTFLVFLFTLPLLLYQIGQTTLVTLISSIFLLWLVGPITILGLLTLFFCQMIPAAFQGIIYVLLWFPVEMFIRFVNLMSTFSFLTLSLSTPSILGCIVYYFILLMWCFTIIAKHNHDR